MKRNCVRNLVGMLMVLCIGITVMSGSATAANTTWSGYDEKDWVVAPVPASNLEGYSFISFSELESEQGLSSVTVTNVKSSNKKVAKAEGSDGYLDISYGMRCGTTKISFTINGVAYEHNFTVQYICPFKTFKIGKTSYMSNFKKKHFYVTKKTLKNQKLTVKCKKNWVITRVSTCKKGKEKSKTFASGKASYTAKYSAPQMMDGITFTVRNLVTGFEEEVAFSKAYDTRYAVAG